MSCGASRGSCLGPLKSSQREEQCQIAGILPIYLHIIAQKCMSKWITVFKREETETDSNQTGSLKDGNSDETVTRGVGGVIA